MAVPFTINYFAGPALAALGRSGTLAKIAVLQLTLTIVLSLLAAPFGLTAIAAAYVLRAYLTLPVQMAAFKRYSGVGYGALLGAIAPPLLMGLVMAACLLALDYVVGARFQSRGVFLLLMVCTGATVYVGSMLLFARSFVFQQIRDIRRLIPGSAKLFGAGAHDHGRRGSHPAAAAEGGGGAARRRRSRPVLPAGLPGSPKRGGLRHLAGCHDLLPRASRDRAELRRLTRGVLRGGAPGLGSGGADRHSWRRELRGPLAQASRVPGAPAGAIPGTGHHPAPAVDPLRASRARRADRARDRAARTIPAVRPGSTLVRVRDRELRVRGPAVPGHGVLPRCAGPHGCAGSGRLLPHAHRQGARARSADRADRTTPPGWSTG